MSTIHVEADKDLQLAVSVDTSQDISHLLFNWMKRSAADKRTGRAKSTFVIDHVLSNRPEETSEKKHSIDSWIEPPDSQVVLRITKAQVKDSGLYFLTAESEETGQHVRIPVLVIVKGKPDLEIVNAQEYYVKGRNYSIQCNSHSYNPPTTWWQWMPCNSLDSCDNSTSKGWIDEADSKAESMKHPARIIRMTDVTLLQTGILRCHSENEYGVANADVVIHLTDAADGFDLVPSADQAYLGDTIDLTCRASPFRFGSNMSLEWFFEPFSKKPQNRIKNHLSANDKILIENKKTDLSVSSILTIRNMNKTDAGTYTCTCYYGTEVSHADLHHQIKVLDPVPMKITKTNLKNDYKTMITGKSIMYTCMGTGAPKPKVAWKKNGVRLHNGDSNDQSFIIDEKNGTLKISSLTLEDSGLYECVLYNIRNETLTIVQELNVVQATTVTRIIFFVMGHVAVSLIGISAIVLAVFLIRRRIVQRNIRLEEERIRQERSELSFNLFSTDVARHRYKIDPKRFLDEQVNNLQYDNHKWEIPRKRVLMLETIGHGYYGKVVKAAVIGLPGEPLTSTTTVAVKKLRKHGDNINQAKVLLSQLKLLCNLGRGHVNIVNLLAACTVDLAAGRLMLIVDYCDYGNIKEFLVRNRAFYVDQIDHETGDVDTSITTLPEIDSDTDNEDDSTEAMINSPHGDPIDNPTLEGEKKIPAEGINVTTSDLICYAFQIARGMSYLHSHNLIHRNLMARNILLTHGNVVKICGFGVATNDEDYKLRSDRQIPFKWRATECLKNKVFNEKTDVWSFAVTCWELFCLGATPYPGIRVDQAFIEFLEAGYRMSQPDYCPSRVWETVVRQCWIHDPDERPDFNMISNRLAACLEEKVVEKYIRMDAAYKGRKVSDATSTIGKKEKNGIDVSMF